MTTTSSATVQRSRSLWANRDFNTFWLVQTLSVAGDSFSYVAIPLLVLHSTGSVTQMGLLTGLAGVASIAAGILAGVVVDGVDRKVLLIGCDIARALLYAIVPLAWAVSPQVWLLYVVMPLGAAVAMVFQVAYVTAVPSLVDAGRITDANGRLYATYAAAGVLGPLLAGMVSGFFGPTTAIAVDAATFAISALGLCFVRLRAPATMPGTAPDTGRQISWQSLLLGGRFLFRNPVLRALAILLSLLTFLTFGLTDLYIYYLKHDLGQSDRTVGYVLAAAAIGAIVAALLVARARRSLGFGACWIGSYALCGLALAGLGLSADVSMVALLVTTIVFATSTAGICSMSLRQELTPDHLLGRVTSAFWTIHSAPGPLGAGLLTAAAARFGPAAVFLVAGVACVLIALSGVLTPIRQSRPERWESVGRL